MPVPQWRASLVLIGTTTRMPVVIRKTIFLCRREQARHRAVSQLQLTPVFNIIDWPDTYEPRVTYKAFHRNYLVTRIAYNVGPSKLMVPEDLSDRLDLQN